MGRPPTHPNTLTNLRRRVQYRESKARRRLVNAGFQELVLLNYSPLRVSELPELPEGPGWRKDFIINAADEAGILVILEN